MRNVQDKISERLLEYYRVYPGGVFKTSTNMLKTVNFFGKEASSYMFDGS